jgi:O-glycosyl hydrolase
LAASQDPYDQRQGPVQRRLGEALNRIAEANKVPLKFLLSVWSPPSSMKCLSQAPSYLPVEGTAPQSTTNRSSLCTNLSSAFADWLIAGLEMHRQAGIPVYALSFQNEPYFTEPYDSCFYVQSYYAQALAYVAPRIKATFPNVKLFGPENMLFMEAGSSKDYHYLGEIKTNAAALAALDVKGQSPARRSCCRRTASTPSSRATSTRAWFQCRRCPTPAATSRSTLW